MGNPQDSACYMFKATPKGWLDARRDCKNTDGVGDLAIILTPGTNNFITSLIPDSPEPNQLRPWIGGFQVIGPEPAKGWRWVPDFTLNIFAVYNNFAAGEPNNLG